MCFVRQSIFHFWYEKISVSSLSLHMIHIDIIYMMFDEKKKLFFSINNAKGIINIETNTAHNKLTFPEIWNTFFSETKLIIESNSPGRRFVKVFKYGASFSESEKEFYFVHGELRNKGLLWKLQVQRVYFFFLVEL
jgi:hypothetical protein